MTGLLENAEPELQVVMRAVDAVHWEKKPDGTIIIYQPKIPKPRRGRETYLPREVDLACLERIKYRLSTDQPLQDFEAIECRKKPAAKRPPKNRGGRTAKRP